MSCDSSGLFQVNLVICIINSDIRGWGTCPVDVKKVQQKDSLFLYHHSFRLVMGEEPSRVYAFRVTSVVDVVSGLRLLLLLRTR